MSFCFSLFNDETYNVGWMDGYISIQHPHTVNFTCPFVLDVCFYNHWQTGNFLIDEISTVVFFFFLSCNLERLKQPNG